MNLISAIATVSAIGALYLPVSGLSPSASQAAPLSPSQASLEGPLKNYVVTNKTYKSVEDVVGVLKREFESNNFMVKAIIDHQVIAKSQGLEVPPNTALLVGLPSFEAPIVKANPAASLFVPLTVAVWREGSITYIAYWNPNTDFNNNLGPLPKDVSVVVNAMKGTLSQIVKNAL